MPAAPIPDTEKRRLTTLLQCGVLDTDPEPSFDAITRVAASMFDVPIALISLVDENRQWFKSAHGLDVCETPREQAFCAYSILDPDPLVIPDATLDPRTADNPLVTGSLGIRFYAGAPVILDGSALGTLCIIDNTPRQITPDQVQQLRSLAMLAAEQLSQRKQLRSIGLLNQELRLTLDAVPAFIYLKDGNNKILNINRTAADAMQMEIADIIGRQTEEFFPEKDAASFLEDDRSVLATGRPLLGIEEDHIGGNGKPHRIRTDKIPLKNELGEFDRLVAIATDITALERSKLDLQRKNAELERFVYTASHDLKSPLVTILGFCSYVHKDLEAERFDEIHAHAERIARAGERMRDHIDDLLQLSRIGRSNASPVDTDTAGVIRGVIEDHRAELESTDIRFDIDPATPTLRCDPTRFKQIAENLIGNAIRYGCPNGQGRITISTRTNDEGLFEFRVDDQGPGIDPRHAERVFELFQRLDSSSKGTGVGLAIVRQIAESTGGHAWIVPGPSGGSSFRVCLGQPRGEPRESEIQCR